MTLDSLDDILALRELDAAEVAQTLALEPDDYDEDRSYEALSGVTHVYKPERCRAHLYLRDGVVAVVYVSDNEVLGAFDAASLDSHLGGGGAVLRSRQCKSCLLHVYAEKGVAFSADREKIGFVEAFAPMTLDDYRRMIYVEPPAFIK